jgi:hypothetical protein
MKGVIMKTFTIYAQNENEPRYSLATITGDNADKVVDMLFDYQEWADYEIFFDTIWAEEDSNE